MNVNEVDKMEEIRSDILARWKDQKETGSMKQLTFSCCIAMAMLLGSGDQTYAKSERFPDHQWDEINIQARPGREAVQLELLQKFSNIEPILNYGEDTLYRQLSKSVGRLKVDIAGTDFLSCSATLISHNKILTSAHCVPGREQYGKVLKAKLEMGYIDPRDTSKVQTYQVNPIPLAWDFWNDIAILQVDGDP